MHRTNRRAHLTAAASLLVLLWAAPATAGETIRIAIGTQDTTINTIHAGLVIRELKLLDKHLPRTGKYKDVSYDIVWKNFTSGPPLNGEMLAGKLDIGSLGDFPSILNGVSFAKAGSRSVYIATLSGSLLGAGNGLVVPADSPAQSLKDLKGKQLSVPFGSAAHAMLLRAIRDLGWDPDRDVTLVSQAPEVGGSALRSRKIDGHANFVPFAELFPFRGFARKIYDGSEVKQPTSHGLVAHGAFVDQHPDLVVAFLKAVIEADRLLAAEPEKLSALVHKVAGVDAEVVYVFHGPLGIQTRDLSIKPEWRKSLQTAYETLTLLKRVEGKLEIDRWIDDRFVRRAFKESGLDYEARLASRAPVPLTGKDARTGVAIAADGRPAEIWVAGEAKVRRYTSAASAFAALTGIEKQQKQVRVTLVHDQETGLKLLADKASYVVAGGKLAAFLTRAGAERWATGQGKAQILTFDAARGAAATLASRETAPAGSHASLP
jgi:NitT/TauT family transport system substrate-binding protein